MAKKFTYYGSKQGAIDPMSFGQPLVYYQSFDTAFITPSGITNDTRINQLTRYNDGNFSTAGAETSSFKYIDNELPLPYGVLRTYGSSNNQRKVFGNLTTFAPLCTQGLAFSLFFAGKPLASGADTRMILSSGIGAGNTTGTKLEILVFNDSGNIIFAPIVTNNGNRLFGFTSGSWDLNIPIADFNSSPFRLFSSRIVDNGNTTDIASWAYINKNLQRTSVQTSTLSSITTTSTKPTINGKGDGTGNLGIGSMGELIIINQLLTEEEHLRVAQFIMNRWGIT